MTEYNMPAIVALNGFTNGNSIQMKGTVKPVPIPILVPEPVPESFTVKIDCPEGIAFRMIVDFNKDNKSEVKCNSFLNGYWGPEEVHPNPFPNSSFGGTKIEMIIIAEAKHYNIWVNGKEAFRYKYRYQDLAKINYLQVEGDLDRKVYITVG